MTGTAQIVRGDARRLPLADNSVDLIVTSPPYFGLRSYQDSGEHYAGQIGSEATPSEWLDALIECTAEWMRVLKPSGSMFVNLGDKYAVAGMPPKSLAGLPWRYALRCVDDLGLILRAEIIWSKPNGLPESVTDRVRRSHETWFHFVTQPRYYSAVDEIREPHTDPVGNAKYQGRYAGTGNPDRADRGAQWVPAHPLGKLPGSVWTIPSDDAEKPWIPQAVAAELMQMVADGVADPQSVADLLAGDFPRSHEQWFHFVMQPRYFSAVDQIREEMAGEFLSSGVRNPRFGRVGGLMPHEARGQDSARAVERTAAAGRDYETRGANHPKSLNPLGKLPGSVWSIPSEPLTVPDHLGVDHFAAYPTEWPRRIIQGWSPRGVCTACGEGRRPVVQESRLTTEGEQLAAQRGAASVAYSDAVQTGGPTGASFSVRRALSGTELRRMTEPATITGEACACPDTSAATAPGVILDPFGGTGTTALTAKALDRHGITVDMSADYCRLATWRVNDPKQLAKAARRDFKPPTEQVEGQGELFQVEPG